MIVEPCEDTWQALPLPGADVRYAASWLVKDEADRLLERLLDEISWEQHRFLMFGREVSAPRLSCWIGGPGTTYMYSRTRFEPRTWTPSLTPLRARLEQFCGAHFNSVLANLYRDGRDSMGWHSDDEPELGEQPVIASLSLGATRRFRLRRRVPRGTRLAPADTMECPLAHGSLLLMAGATQRLYQHDLPKSAAVDTPRINLTFRYIHTLASRRP
ncbi:alpha-ketoglutarate-dependent dioxygenase AlkB [Dyella dinghuensis]|uniref:Alpha-ketoglutarate-dependent dioxygenase AlkB n=1 Tax=Dyella dinghuensis TaxID=1920169 RepID=A0A432LUE5_9GAMM|nr:alpha-ketoglutarate-dependent dioxygenase AlkB [Dyella dinghuensis]RUL64266.1 alpha-ketoglutarate-dependent dioxygenase AlkB [Dyella dinghuensis]